MISKYKCIVVDDEPHARFRLREILEQTQKFDVLAEAKDGVEGIDLINRLKPEVVFLDIQMPCVNGFQMLDSILYDPFVIFCTAYDQFALKAFETRSIDYLLKPVELPRLIKTIEKLYRLSEQATIINQIRAEIQISENKVKSTIIPVKIGDRTILVNLDNVTHFIAKDKAVQFYNINGKSYLSDYSLQTLESKLPVNFIRVSRSAIINSNHILELRKYFKGNYILVLNNQEKSKVVTGNIYSKQVKNLLAF